MKNDKPFLIIYKVDECGQYPPKLEKDVHWDIGNLFSF